MIYSNWKYLNVLKFNVTLFTLWYIGRKKQNKNQNKCGRVKKKTKQQQKQKQQQQLEPENKTPQTRVIGTWVKLGVSFFYPYQKLSNNISSIMSQWRHNNRPAQNSRFSVKDWRKLKISLKKLLIFEIHRVKSAFISIAFFKKIKRINENDTTYLFLSSILGWNILVCGDTKSGTTATSKSLKRAGKAFANSFEVFDGFSPTHLTSYHCILLTVSIHDISKWKKSCITKLIDHLGENAYR